MASKQAIEAAFKILEPVYSQHGYYEDLFPKSQRRIDKAATIIDQHFAGYPEARVILEAIHKKTFDAKASDLYVAIEKGDKAEIRKRFDEYNDVISDVFLWAESALSKMGGTK